MSSPSVVVETWTLSVVVDPLCDEPAVTMTARYDDGSYAVAPSIDAGPFDSLADVLQRGYEALTHQQRLL